MQLASPKLHDSTDSYTHFCVDYHKVYGSTMLNAYILPLFSKFFEAFIITIFQPLINPVLARRDNTVKKIVFLGVAIWSVKCTENFPGAYMHVVHPHCVVIVEICIRMVGLHVVETVVSTCDDDE